MIGNYPNDKAPNQMEIYTLKLMKKDLLDHRINILTCDGDIKIRKLITSLDRRPVLVIAKDPGQVLISMMRTVKYLNSYHKKNSHHY